MELEELHFRTDICLLPSKLQENPSFRFLKAGVLCQAEMERIDTDTLHELFYGHLSKPCCFLFYHSISVSGICTAVPPSSPKSSAAVAVSRRSMVSITRISLSISMAAS